jgi:hypothetical protein
MSSIARACGHRCKAEPLALLKPKDLKSKRIVLLLLDGLGYEFLKKNKGFLWEHTKGRMTSVFPSTTAAAITSIRTGVPPSEHAVTGWFMYAKEYGAVLKILPGFYRAGGPVDTTPLFSVPPLYPRLRRKSFIVAPVDVSGSDYTKYHSRGATVFPYQTIAGFVNNLKRALKSRSCFVYAYWPGIDGYAHHYGTTSMQTVKHLRALEQVVKHLMTTMKDTTVIVTGDHGLIDVDRKHMLHLDDHPKLAATLSMPFSGEARALYCYVHPSKDREFKSYVHKRLGHACTLYRSSDLVDWYGPGKRNPKLVDRIGDYVLVMKDNYVMRDRLVGEAHHIHKASHGGVSKEEMYVPLIILHSEGP